MMERYLENDPFPKRKYSRLKEFDYGGENFYFITICTDQKKCIFGDPGILNFRGKMVNNAILQIPEHFSGIRVDKFVIMPNHVHLILEVEKKVVTYLMQSDRSKLLQQE